MNKITFLFIFMFVSTWQSNAQCTSSTSLYPLNPVIVNNDGLTHEISGCNFFGDYSIVQGFNIGDDYSISVSGPGYVTVADGATVLTSGVSPLNWTATVQNVLIYWNNDASCGIDASCHISRYINLTNVPPPAPNDECSGAISLDCGDIATGNTSLATDSGGNSNAAPDLWYSYTGSGAAQDVTVSLCNSGYDTVLRVYSDCSVTSGAQVLFNDDACGVQGRRSEGTFLSDGTTTYYILVEGYGTNAGLFELVLSCANAVPAPPNDLCINAQPLDLNVLTTGTTAGATDDSTNGNDDTTCEGFTYKSDVWYTFVAVDQDVSIETTITGSSDQANVAVYDTNNSVDCTQLDSDSIACKNGNGGESFNVTGLVADNTYYIRVWSDGVAPRYSEPRIEGTFTIIVNDATLSTKEFENASAFTYYPNPVKDELTLKAQSNIQNVSVYNLMGQEVLNIAPNSLKSDVNMNHLQTGAYFIKVTINDSTKTIRVIKQ